MKICRNLKIRELYDVVYTISVSKKKKHFVFTELKNKGSIVFEYRKIILFANAY